MPRESLLILSDSASGITGLSRIGRELALNIHRDLSDKFRVGVAGCGGNYSSRLPFPNYPITQLQNMVPVELPRIWQDFAGDDGGTVLCIWNLAWLAWLACPERLPIGHPLREFLMPTATKPESLTDAAWNKLNPQMQRIIGKSKPAPFKKWLYCPVDGELPDGTMGKEAEPVLKGFDRVLAYTKYGARVIAKTMGIKTQEEAWADVRAVSHERSIGKDIGAYVSDELTTGEIAALDALKTAIPNLPHGLDASIFYPRDKAEARRTLIHRLSEGKTQLPIGDDVTLLGCVATNSFRKDWGLCFETVAELLKCGLNVFLWCHTNSLGADNAPNIYWNLLSLANQFGLGQRVILTSHNISDEDMAWCYSALDCSLGIGSGEGWGFPLAESLACGVPVVHGDYAGGTDFVPDEYLVASPAHRLESKWMIRRPSFVAKDWASKVIFCLIPEGQTLAKLPSYIQWSECWKEWKKWLLAGIEAKDGVEASQGDSPETADVAPGEHSDSDSGD